MQTKLELFQSQTLEKQREILIHMLEPFKERSLVFATTLKKVESSNDTSFLSSVMERMLQISDNIAQKKKDQKMAEMEASQQKLKNLHEQELQDVEEDLDDLLQKELADLD